MDARVIKYDESRERYTDERCHILESWNDPGDPDVAIARARAKGLPPSMVSTSRSSTRVR